jgi:hypothetical protein
MTEDRTKDAGAPETEITPEMIEAGAEVIWTYFYDVAMHGSKIGREAATQVYQAMRRLEKSTQSAAPPQSRQAFLSDRDTI